MTDILVCSVCLSEFDWAQSYNCCPNCKTTNLPFLKGDDITITLNVQEARCLTMWAANYAEKCGFSDDSMKALSRTIQKFREVEPDIAWTMGDEMRLLREKMPTATRFNSKGELDEPQL